MIETLPLFRPLNEKLITLLGGLSSADWEKKTVAGNWTVKDIAAHLLDGNVRCISLYRDLHKSGPAEKISGYSDLVNYLNLLNADWVKAFKRMSPSLLIEWLSQTHETFISCLEKLDPLAQAMFSVAWAGDEVSPNWFHIAREFTEKWHHQQQIRDAVDRPGILTKAFYRPVLDTFMRALPHQYKTTDALTGSLVQIKIDSDAGGVWLLEKGKSEWQLCERVINHNPIVTITLSASNSWKLFTKAVRYQEVENNISIVGEKRLAMPLLQMITVMA